MSKVFIDTVGCPKNHEDSERMAGLLAEKGHEIVFDPSFADVIIVNTCGFIEAAKRESIETIFDYTPYKEAGKRLILTGCMTQRYPDELMAEIPEADAIFGVNDYDKLPDVVSVLTGQDEAAREDNDSSSDAGNAGRFCEAGAEPGVLTVPRKALSPRYSSYLKIAEGCSNNCAYCAIPGIRGPYRSVPIEQLLADAGTLAKEGCRELILIAQDVTWYGKDLYGEFALPRLLRELCASERARGIEWVRLLYCYEERVTDELIEVMANEPKLVKYIDLPLQHVNDRLLKNMRRASTERSIRGVIDRLRAAMPGIVIRTTFITGLPGETEQDFEELYDFAKEVRFDRLGVFAYSPEEGTDAANMPCQTPPGIAAARRDELMLLQQRISFENNERLTGSIQDVIVCERESDGVYIGRTRGDAPEIDNAVIFSAPAPVAEGGDDIIGSIVKVRITDAMDYDLVGELVSG